MSAGGKLTLDSLSLVIAAAVNAPQLEQRRSPARPLGRLFSKVAPAELWGGHEREKIRAHAVKGQFATSGHAGGVGLG